MFPTSRTVPLLAGTTLALTLTACGTDTTTIETENVSVDVPSSWVELPAEEQTIWDHVYADDADDPTAILRASSDMELATAADTSLGSLQGIMMFGEGYEDFSTVDNSDVDIDRADRALRSDFTFADEDGTAREGHWWLMSSRSNGITSGVELTGADLDPELVSAVEESVDYHP